MAGGAAIPDGLGVVPCVHGGLVMKHLPSPFLSRAVCHQGIHPEAGCALRGRV